MKVSTKLGKYTAGLSTLAVSATALAADAPAWDSSGIIASINTNTGVIVAIGVAILGVLAMIFGFKLIKRML